MYSMRVSTFIMSKRIYMNTKNIQYKILYLILSHTYIQNKVTIPATRRIYNKIFLFIKIDVTTYT